MENYVIIYTDGSCLKNPGPGGWAYLLKYKNSRTHSSGSESHTTNNRMELTAVIKGIEAIKRPHRLKIHIDSEYIYNAFKKGWLKKWKSNGFIGSNKGPVKNKDLWERLSSLAERHDINWIKVKAHASDADNIFVDKLARKSASRQLDAQKPYSKEFRINDSVFTIRSFKYSDISQLKKLNDITLNKKGRLEKQGLSDKDFEHLSGDHSTVRILECNNIVIGFYWTVYDPDYFKKYFNDHYDLTNTIYLIAIAVHPSYQGKGLAKRLMKDFYDFAKDNNKNRVLLDVAFSNSNAYEWYLREGFFEAEKQIYMLKDL